MFLGVDILLKLVKEKKLVENLSARELENPEGAGFDLRMGAVFKLKGRGYLGVQDRVTGEAVSVGKYSSCEPRSIIFKPGDFYLVRTIEKVNLPANLVGILKPRSSLQRMGIYLRTTQISPGYRGALTFAMKNLGPIEVKVELGARIVHVMFAEVKGGTALYRGQWQGGRVAAKKLEKQV